MPRWTGDTAVVLVEDRDELESRAPRASRYWRRVDTRDVPGVLELGDRPLGHIESAGLLDLADRLSAVTPLTGAERVAGLDE